MPRNNSKFSWSILILLQLNIAVMPENIPYPDSYEMYSYKEPRSMNDLKQQHVRQAMIDVTQTINEVQKILQKDPRLPRLTRGELEDLFEMVTREEYKRSLAMGDFERAKHMRSLMLVLPFNTNNYSEERLEELFTQMPVTKIINTESKSPKPQQIVIPASAENSILDSIGAYSDRSHQQLPTTFKPNFPTNMKTTYTAPVTTFHPKGTIQTVPAINSKMTTKTVPQLYPKTTDGTISTFHPKTTVQNIENLHSKVTMQTIANIPQEKSPFATPSTFYPKTNLQKDSVNSIPVEFVSTYHPKTATFKVTQESNVASSLAPVTNQKFNSRNSGETTYFTSSVTPTIRPNVINMLASLGLEPDDTPTISIESQSLPTISGPTTERSITTTTMTTTTTTTTPKPELTPELKELLQSFGLLTNEEVPAHVTSGPYQDEFLPVFSSSLKDETLSVSEFKPLPKSLTASDIEDKASEIENSFEIKPDDFSSFKPLPLPLPEEKTASDEELEKLLKSYGILEEDERGSKAVDAEIERLNNDSEESGSETFEVTEKSYNKISQVPEVDVGFLSPDLAKVLSNIGVKSVNSQPTSSTPVITRRIDTTGTAEYTTDGQAMSSTMKDDYRKLHLLLDTIRQLDRLNSNLTEDELDRLNLKNFNLSKDTLLESEGPDPKYDTHSALKNEVKRQVNSSEPTRIQLDITSTTLSSSDNSSTVSDDDIGIDSDNKDDVAMSDDVTKSDDETTSESPKREGKNEDLAKEDEIETEASTLTTSSTTEEPRNGSISDLANSFGGNDGLDSVSEEALPPPRKNGFYFFSDWNSFLEVGEDPDKVVVRFDPKIGDPTQFIPVKIP